LNEAKAGILVAVAWGCVTEATVLEALESIRSLGGRIHSALLWPRR